MQLAANPKVVARTRAQDDAAFQFAGLLIVALFPALFWTALVGVLGAAVGHSPTPVALMSFGAAVAAFCASVFHALTARV